MKVAALRIRLWRFFSYFINNVDAVMDKVRFCAMCDHTFIPHSTTCAITLMGSATTSWNAYKFTGICRRACMVLGKDT